MITIDSINRFNNSLTIMALSTDIKPIKTVEYKKVKYEVENGSTFYEMDTKKAFMYDEENHVWHDV